MLKSVVGASNIDSTKLLLLIWW